MQATTYTDFRKYLKKYLDKATDDFEPITITRKNQQNVVLISEEKYNNMLENQYVLDNPVNQDWLQDSLKQARRGQLVKHDLINLGDGESMKKTD